MRCIDRIQCLAWVCSPQGWRLCPRSRNWGCFYVSECALFVYLIHRHLGSFGAQIALASGATVIATSSSDAKLEVVKKLGVQHVINYNTNPDWEDEVLEIVSGHVHQYYSMIDRPSDSPRLEGEVSTTLSK